MPLTTVPKQLQQQQDLAVGGTATANLADGAVTTVKLADGGVTPVKMSQKPTLGTAQASTSGTSKDFTGIPSWAKRVTVSFSGISCSGTSPIMVQLGTSSGVEATGYLGSSGYIQNASQSLAAQLSSGIYLVKDNAAANLTHGTITFVLIDTSSNTWAFSGILGNSNNVVPSMVAGSKALAGTLDRVRVTTLNGTDTFDAGSVNILYEG